AISDPYRDLQWALDIIGADEAAQLPMPDNQIEVAVIDTGVDVDHPDLLENLDMVNARDFSNPYNPTILTSDVSYINGKGGHGTHVAGIIAAVAQNGEGVSGAAVNNRVTVLPINVFYPDPNNNTKVVADTLSVVAAYQYLLSLDLPDLKVINLSLGGSSQDMALKNVIEQAKAAGMLTVCAAGNDNSSLPFYPSDFEAVVSVTATTISDERAPYSSYNRYKDISAPGGRKAFESETTLLEDYELGVMSTVPNDAYGLMIGTSMAAPYVSAAAALVYCADPLLTTEQVKDILYDTSVDLGSSGWDEYFGWGRLDLDSAVTEALRRATGSVVDLYGDTRYDTMEQIIQGYVEASQLEPSTSDTVIIASGEDYPDALAASGLAGRFDAPILLTPANELSDQTARSLEALAPTRILALGGEAALSTLVFNRIQQVVPAATVTRIAGETRIQTAWEIYRQSEDDPIPEAEAWGDTAIVTTGYQFADALTIAPYAYRTCAPVFLTQRDGSLSSQVQALLISGAFRRVILIGGSNAIPDVVASSIEQAPGETVVFRWWGDNRYMTSAVVANNAVEEGVFSWEGVGFATGRDFPDALSAAPLLGYQGYPLLLVDESISGRYAINELLMPNRQDIWSLLFFGGSDVLPEALRDSIKAAVSLW
ncbi:MAG: S8 family serine peptidase, partial [Coriobacteriaceae bacterium]|nr:S8 family serine peptidase [Coriobacteriaceae bacterium]